MVAGVIPVPDPLINARWTPCINWLRLLHTDGWMDGWMNFWQVDGDVDAADYCWLIEREYLKSLDNAKDVIGISLFVLLLHRGNVFCRKTWIITASSLLLATTGLCRLTLIRFISGTGRTDQSIEGLLPVTNCRCAKSGWRVCNKQFCRIIFIL